MGVTSLKNDLVKKFKEDGEDKFCRFLLIYAMNKIVLIDKKEYKGIPPDQEFLSYHDKYIILYRREGDEIYLQLAKIFRKIAHKMYRISLKKGLTNYNKKFLNLCQ